MKATNLYATDGKCHNSEAGCYNQECGNPAVWLGTDRNGFASGFCEPCKEHGREARGIVHWEAINKTRGNPHVSPETHHHHGDSDDRS
jgi:hypothetical protein